MKVTIKITYFSLIIFATLGASAARAADDGIGFLDTLDREDSGRVVLGNSGFDSATAGYAAPVPFGPMINVDGVFGQGRGYDTNYYRINAFIPMHIIPAESLAFVSLNGGVTEDGKSLGSFGFGYRQYVKNLDRVFSASGWFDYDDGHNETYYQAGLSFSSMGKYLDLHINGTMIVGKDSNVIIRSIQDSRFVGHNILQNLVTLTENAYSGVDAELGGPLPFIGRYGVSAYAGGYYMNSREDEQTSGVRVRMLSRFSDDATVGMEYTSDGIFGDTAFVNVSLSFPPGRRTRWFRQRPVRERLADRVNRNGRIAARVRAEKQIIFAVNPKDDQPYFVVHVDPNRSAQGIGTFENPFNTLEAARNPNPAITDIFRVIPRTDGTNINLAMNGTFVLSECQRLLASSSTNIFTTIAGTFVLPGYTGPGAGPLISNNSLVSSYVIEMTGDNEVRGFIIDGNDALGNPIHSGIEGNGTSGFSITDNTFQNVVEGVVISNTGSGDGILTSNTFNGHGILSNRAFALNNSNGATLNLTVQSNTVTNHLGEDINFNGILDAGEDVNPANGLLDPGIAFEIIASGGSTINASGSMAIFNNSAIGNGTGLVLTAETGSTINATIQNNFFNNNSDPTAGVNITSDGAGSIINLFAFANNQVNNNGGNGLLLTTLNTGVINSLLSEDLNNNGLLDVGEDLNANAFLDLGITGNTITGNAINGIAAVANNGAINNLHIGGVDDLLPDNTVIGTIGLADNVLTGNGTGTSGSGIFLSALAGGTITGSILNNDLEGNLQNGIELDAQTGSVTLAAIQNNNLQNNPESGISLTGTGGTIATGSVGNNNFNRITTGQNGIFFNTVGVNVSGTVTNNTFVVDTTSNTNGSFGIGGTVESGSLNLTIGGILPAEGNLFDFNTDAAIGIELAGTATGSINIRNNTIIRTALGSDPTYLGEGIHLRLRDTAQYDGASIIDANVIGDLTDPALGNASHGIAVNLIQDAQIADLLIGNVDGDNDNGNIISNNGGDGINFVRRQNGVLADVRIVDNTITLNGDDGLDLTAANANSTDFYDVIDNNISNNTDDGIALRVESDADLNIDIVNNLLDMNGGDGIQITEQIGDPSDSRSVSGNWTGNTITNSVTGHGILISGASGGLVIGSPAGGNPALGNLIDNNALDGVEINGAGTVTLGDNIITNNGETGVDFNPATVNTLNLFDNLISQNSIDGLEIRNNESDLGPVVVLATGNTITLNGARGVDILNQADTDFVATTLTVTLNNNDISLNRQEGVYVVNTASTTQDQIGLAPDDPTDIDPADGMNADGSVFGVANLTLNMDSNNIDGNGADSILNATGLVVRVGTMDGRLDDFTDDGGFADTRGGIVANLNLNTFEGNFGDDIIFESFVSTVDPAATAGTWDATTFTVTAFQSDPLSRLDLTYTNNTINSVDVNNIGSFFTNAEVAFKSREDGQTDPGPFPAAGGDTRRRNAQRQAARNVGAGGSLLLPITPGALSTPNSDTFLYSGLGESTFRITTASDKAAFALDNAPYVQTSDANGVNFLGALLFGELPWGWTEF